MTPFERPNDISIVSETNERDSEIRKVFSTDIGPEDDISPAAAVVNAVAAVSGHTPADLPPLHDCINSDALRTMFGDAWEEPERSSVNITFAYAGYIVEVHGDREIIVYDESPSEDF